MRSPGWALRPQATGPKGRGRRCSPCAWSGPVLEGGQAAGRGGLGPPGSSPCVHLFHWQTGRLRAESLSSVFLLMRHLLEQCFSVITKDAEELSFWVHSISW